MALRRIDNHNLKESGPDAEASGVIGPTLLQIVRLSCFFIHSTYPVRVTSGFHLFPTTTMAIRGQGKKSGWGTAPVTPKKRVKRRSGHKSSRLADTFRVAQVACQLISDVFQENEAPVLDVF